MAQEDVSKVNVYADIGAPPATSAVSHITVYAIVNNETPPPPPPPFELLQNFIFVSRSNHG